MPKNRTNESRPAEVLTSSETSAISIMRSLPADQRQDAFEWFKKSAEDRGIRGQILKILESYAIDPTKR